MQLTTLPRRHQAYELVHVTASSPHTSDSTSTAIDDDDSGEDGLTTNSIVVIVVVATLVVIVCALVTASVVVIINQRRDKFGQFKPQQPNTGTSDIVVMSDGVHA